MTLNLQKIYVFAFLFIISATITLGQEVVLEGKVTSQKTGEPLPGVLVTLRPAESNKIVKYTQTSSEGTYRITLSSFPDNHDLHFRMMSYATRIVHPERGKQIYDVQLEEKPEQLKEVEIKAPGIYEKGDTVKYIISNFADIQDKTLGDVLKKMPGIEVSKSGQIKYNGKDINKFYIEGRDLLGNRYGLATNSIDQKNVGSVEVLQNHQPIKALEDLSFSQDPAINIRLKEDAKARWVGTVKAGGGYESDLWSAEAIAMRFKPKSQSLNTYKGNNTGKNITREAGVFEFSSFMKAFYEDYHLRNYISVSPDYLSDIDAERTRFNKSHLLSTNNLWAAGKDMDVTSQINYTNDRLESNTRTQIKDYLPDTTFVTDINEQAMSKDHHLSADVVLTSNTPTLYLNNKLNADFLWNDIDMYVTGTYPNQQIASTPERSFSNDLDFLKRKDNKTYTFNTLISYEKKPQNLNVHRENETQNQTVNASAFFMNVNTALAFYFNPVTLSLKVGASVVNRSLDSEFGGIPDSLGLLKNDLSSRFFNLYAGPEFEFQKSSFEAKLNVPVSFNPYHYQDHVKNEKHNHSKFFISPKLYMRYHFTSNFSASVSGRITQKPVNEQSFYSGLILQNFRNLSLGYLDFDTGNRQSVNMNLSYKKPLNAFFSSLTVSRSRNRTKRAQNRYFLDEYILNTFVHQKTSSDIWLATAHIGKGWDFIKGMVSINGTYISYQGQVFQNGTETPYSSNTWTLSPKLNSRPLRWLNFSYDLEYRFYKITQQQENMDSHTYNIAQKLKFNITPNEKYYVQLSGEHYYNRLDQTTGKHLFLTDLSFTYHFKGGWELNFSMQNMFNQKDYSYTVYDGLRSIWKRYELHPRSFFAGVYFRF